MTQADASTWIKSHVGKATDFDGVYGAQCVDLIEAYCHDLFGFSTSGNAKDYWTRKWPAGWQQIPNTPSFKPQAGDIVVWKPASWNSNYGHIAIATGSASLTEFQSLDQNWYNTSLTKGSPAAYVEHTYTGTYAIYGVIRPKWTTKPAPAPAAPKGDDMATLTTKTDVNFLYQTMLGRAHKGTEGYDVFLNKDYRVVANELYNSTEAKNRRASDAKTLSNLKTQAAKVDTLSEQVASDQKLITQLQDELADVQKQLGDSSDGTANLKTELQSAQSQISDLTKVNSNLQAQIDKLTKQAAAQSNDTTQLNSLGKTLQWLLIRLGIRS